MGTQRPHIAFLILLWASFSILQSLSIPVQFSIIGNDTDELIASEGRVAELFRQWRVAHRKVYHHPSEEERRFHNFWNNLRYVADNNSKRRSSPAGHQVGLNKFADMSNEEFKQVYLSRKIIRKPTDKKWANHGRSARGSVVSCDAPSSLDWRKEGVVTAVKDQGSCGSCWAFSTTGAIEGINAIVAKDLISLSEQELVDCDTTNHGCEGGNMDRAFEWVINNGGIDSEADYPYLGVDGECNTTKKERKVVTIDGYRDVDPSDSALLCAVVGQPISVGIDGSTIDFQLYTRGIYNGSCSDNPSDIHHAVLIVGYGSNDGEDYWIVKNSWGTEWGMCGYFFLLRNTNKPYGKCAVNAQASYPTKEPSPSLSSFLIRLF